MYSSPRDQQFKERKLLRLPDVCLIVGLTRSGIYRAMHEEQFPRPVRIGARAVAWPFTEILAWINSRPRAHSSSDRGST